MDRFAWITGSNCSQPVYDVPVYETSSFVALPTLGALVQGWLLVVPRRRIPNLAALGDGERAELEAILPEIFSLLRIFGGDVYCFEHGGSVGSQISCGVDQAHLHVVPLEFDLFEVATNESDVTWHMQSNPKVSWQHIVNGTEYLMIRACDRRTAFGSPKSETSQWFRRLIARELGNGDRWNYREYPEFLSINETVSLIGPTYGSPN